MKKIFTSVGFLALGLMASAQGIEIYLPGEDLDVSGTVVDITSGDEVLHQDFDVKNASGSAQTLRITRIKVEELAGTLDYLCWGADAETGACYSAGQVSPENPWTTPDEANLANGAIGWLATYHQTEGNAGCAQYRYYVINDSDERLDSVDVRYCSTVGVKEEIKENISVYPNPANQLVNIVLDQNVSNVSFKLFNVLGDVIVSRNLNKGQNTLSVSDLPNGVYFYAIVYDGATVETKKLVVKH